MSLYKKAMGALTGLALAISTSAGEKVKPVEMPTYHMVHRFEDKFCYGSDEAKFYLGLQNHTEQEVIEHLKADKSKDHKKLKDFLLKETNYRMNQGELRTLELNLVCLDDELDFDKANPALKEAPQLPELELLRRKWERMAIRRSEPAVYRIEQDNSSWMR